MSIPRSRVCRRRPSAFSLVELLVVITILCVLTVMSVPGMKGVLAGYSISGAADVVAADLTQARQTAMSRNVPVEVRFYKQADATGDGWRMMALVIPADGSGAAQDEWITPGHVLPGSVVMEDSGEFSTVLSATAQTPPTTASTGRWTAPWKGTETSSTAPSALVGKDYRSFRFAPNGSTNLPSSKAWCLTFKTPASKPDGTRPASNFISLVIDSQTGRALAYQP